jgi:hypothetical protein
VHCQTSGEVDSCCGASTRATVTRSGSPNRVIGVFWNLFTTSTHSGIALLPLFRMSQHNPHCASKHTSLVSCVPNLHDHAISSTCNMFAPSSWGWIPYPKSSILAETVVHMPMKNPTLSASGPPASNAWCGANVGWLRVSSLVNVCGREGVLTLHMSVIRLIALHARAQTPPPTYSEETWMWDGLLNLQRV